MAQRRMLARRVAVSRKLSRVSVAAALLYSWLIPFSDDFGNFDAEPEMVKAQVVPLRRDMSEEVVADLLVELETVKLIYVYEIDGFRYLHINRHEDFQSQRTDRNPKAEFPLYMPMVSLGDTNGIPAGSLGDDDGRILAMQMEKEMEMEREKEGGRAPAREADPSSPSFPHIPPEIIDALKMSWGTSHITGTLLQLIGQELTNGFPLDWMIKAIEEAAKHDARNWAYLSKIITHWREHGGPKTKAESEDDKRRRDTKERLAKMDEERAREEAEEAARVVDPEEAKRVERTLALGRDLRNGKITQEEFDEKTATLEERSLA